MPCGEGADYLHWGGGCFALHIVGLSIGGRNQHCGLSRPIESISLTATSRVKGQRGHSKGEGGGGHGACYLEHTV